MHNVIRFNTFVTMTQTLPTVLIIIFVFGAIAFIVGVLRRKAHSNSQINTFSDVTIKDLKDGDVLVPEGTSYVNVSTADWNEVKSISPLTDITTNSPYYSGRADINPEFADTTGVTEDELTEFEAPVEEMPKKDQRIHELTEKIGNYQKQLAYWKGDVLKEAEYRGLIKECLRSIDKIRRESNNG